MRTVQRFARCVTLPAFALLIAPTWGVAADEWPQFGGPNRNFMVDAKDLADSWPEDGPRQLWKRELGDGYSTIVSDGTVLYTMYRTGADEFTVALLDLAANGVRFLAVPRE